MVVSALLLVIRLNLTPSALADEVASLPPAKKFMLHRGLGNMDIFTSAAPLSDAELAQLASGELSSSHSSEPRLTLIPSQLMTPT